MTLLRTVAPAAEPLGLAEAKNHLRVDVSDDDALIGALITAAREACEDHTRRALITQTWRLNLDDWPGAVVELKKPPVQSLTTFTYTDDQGNTTAVDPTLYVVDTDSEPARIALAAGKTWPSATLARVNALKVTFQAGYGAAEANVPVKFRQGMLLLLAHWYENREAIVATGAVGKELPLAVQFLWTLDRFYP